MELEAQISIKEKRGQRFSPYFHPNLPHTIAGYITWREQSQREESMTH